GQSWAVEQLWRNGRARAPAHAPYRGSGPAAVWAGRRAGEASLRSLRRRGIGSPRARDTPRAITRRSRGLTFDGAAVLRGLTPVSPERRCGLDRDRPLRPGGGVRIPKTLRTTAGTMPLRDRAAP